MQGKLFYSVRDLVALGIPRVRAEEYARSIKRKSDPDAERGFRYLITEEELKELKEKMQ